MREYLKGWKEKGEIHIPPIPDTGEEDVVIRAYIPPYRKETVEEREKEKEYTDFPEADDEMTVPLKTGVEPEGDNAPTVLLRREVKGTLYLTRCSTGERILVSKDPYIIGKGSECDYIIKGNPSVSRMHIKIYQKDGARYLEDLVSLNHTYVGEQEVTEDIKLEDGMEITLADEVFRVEIEIEK